jgi:nitrogen-specific signal transduction histidine kinase/CheY-like chemotaxis protein
MRYVESTLIGMTRHEHLYGFWLLKRDTTERQKMLQNALRTEKLESLGLLAGGIAHDFNNILTAILGNINLAKMFATPGEKVYERLVEAERGSWRAKGLTEQLLTFSKGGSPVKKVGSIVSLLKESAEFALTGSNVRLDLSVLEDLWSVELDEGQIAQVINNLVINADQAMPDGGLISIAAENVLLTLEQGIALPEGRYVKISITDEGVGISQEHLQRIFDPYFTTKQKGSGLGLATAYSIVKAHGGLIDVQSRPSAGATFRVYLPASDRSATSEEQQGDLPLDGKGRVLIVDDEDMVLDVASQMLRHIGYDAEAARDGDEAIALYKIALGSHRPFAAVIIDLTIPGGMGGKETIKELLEVDPHVRAVVSSGYSNDPIMGNFESFGFKGVVCKPYKVDEINAVLRQVIHNQAK